MKQNCIVKETVQWDMNIATVVVVVVVVVKVVVVVVVVGAEWSVLITQYCAGGKIETNKLGRACGEYGGG